jgi:hypothetical protein
MVQRMGMGTWTPKIPQVSIAATMDGIMTMYVPSLLKLVSSELQPSLPRDGGGGIGRRAGAAA